MNTTKNKQIIEGIIAGDSIVLKSFYKKNLPPVRRLILKYSGTTEDVEDIFQEALVLLYHQLRASDFEIHTSIHAYFMGICKNMWRNQIRKKQLLTYNEQLMENALDPSDSVLETINKEEQQKVYQKHFIRLTDRNKNVLGSYLEGKSMKDIATSNGYTEGYARKKKCMIKERLLRMIQSDQVYQELVMS
ncbi:sigma-70 family RNA polymerase sigma factor [uncultured Aquimarina sp.]|uniref:RNA polymerase sigma factor n=1 Tax=uncultured Aquimarina sp. TaxID=575652 RepID=UPI00260BC857|nr:sigma-70 family RNA polymerase sigma factor [uncultured Aquimarina sp.]